MLRRQIRELILREAELRLARAQPARRCTGEADQLDAAVEADQHVRQRDVTVEQTYANTGKAPIEALYEVDGVGRTALGARPVIAAR